MRKNKVHRLFCISFKVSIKWLSVNNRWPIAVREPTVHGAIHLLLSHHTHFCKSQEASRSGTITEYSDSSDLHMRGILTDWTQGGFDNVLYLYFIYLCCRTFGQLRDSKQSITVSTINGKCVLLRIAICSPLLELHEKLHSFQMFQAL